MDAFQRLPLEVRMYSDVPHEIATREDWDSLRLGGNIFGLPRTRDAWERQSEAPVLRLRAEAIIQLLRPLEPRRICSYGVGTASVELWLSRLAPNIELVCGDFALETVDRLRDLFVEATVVVHDLRDEPLEGDVHLFHRVETELHSGTWREVLARYDQPVLMVLDSWLTPPLLVRSVLRRGNSCGWLRTKKATERMWPGHRQVKEVAAAELPGFMLTGD